MLENNKNRYQKAQSTAFGYTNMHLRNPYIIAWWSAALPGMGHFMLSNYLIGYLLVIWETAINLQGNLNLAIFYTFIGQFEKAKEVIDLRWFPFYPPLYIYAIWDSYRTAVDLNKTVLLSKFDEGTIKPLKFNVAGIEYLDKRIPWLTVVWSLFLPGLGQLYNRKIILAFWIIIWFMIIVHFSHLIPAIYHTIMGEFDLAIEAVQIQWLMFMPSLYVFAFYDAYVYTVELNKLYVQQQKIFLKKHYQTPDFKLL